MLIKIPKLPIVFPEMYFKTMLLCLKTNVKSAYYFIIDHYGELFGSGSINAMY